MPEVAVLVSGSKITGWTSVSISKGIEKIADEVSLELTNQRISATGSWVATGVTRKDVLDAADVIEEDAPIVVQIDGQTVMTGFVFEYDFNYDSNAAHLVVVASSKTADLVDCSAIHKTGTWNDALLTDIVDDLCRPHDITVLTVGDQGEPFKRFKLQPGEKVYDAISRVCDMRGMLPITNEQGDLINCRASSVPTQAVIERGVNIIRAGINRNRRSIFSTYIFKGQTASSDEWYGKSTTLLLGSSDDGDLNRYRPLVVIAQKQKVKEDLGKRATWERNVRSGRSNRYRCTVPGWTWDKAGTQLWQPNMLARVNDDWCDVDGQLLVVSVDMLFGDEFVTALELMDRAAFDVYEKPQPPEKKKKKPRDSAKNHTGIFAK